MPPSSFDPRDLAVSAPNHGTEVGLRYSRHGEDWFELALDYSHSLVGDADTGILSSGSIITLMDSATSVAVWMRCGRVMPSATLDLRIDYLRPSTPGQGLIGWAECYRVARRIAFARGIAHNGDRADPIAHVAGTFMFLDTEEAS